MSFTLRATMRAAVLEAPGRIGYCHRPVPEPGPEEVLIRLEGCGICGSNLEPWKGREWFQYPFEAGRPGHEGWGRVAALGANVVGLHEGQRVAMLSERAFAEFDVARATEVLPLPAELGTDPFPGEPLACVMNILRRAEVFPGSTVAIIGIGFLGACLVQLASAAGARVLALSRREEALQIAIRSGAHEAIVLDDHWRVIQAVKDATDGAGCDRVIECTGHQWPLDLAAELCATRAKLIVAGYHQDGPRQVNMQMWNWKGLDVVNAHERDPQHYMRGMRDALAATLKGTLNYKPLLTHPFSLQDLALGMKALEERPEGFLKGYIDYE